MDGRALLAGIVALGILAAAAIEGLWFPALIGLVVLIRVAYQGFGSSRRR